MTNGLLMVEVARRRLQRRRLAALAVLAALLYTQRVPIARTLRRLVRAVSCVFDTAEALSGAVSSASTDLNEYLCVAVPPSAANYRYNQRDHIPPGLRNRRGPSRAAHRHDSDDDGVPRSVRRLLRVAAAPESLAILRAVSGGAAQGVVRELARDDGQGNGASFGLFGRSKAGPVPRNTGGAAGSIASKLFAALQAPGGEKLATTIVSAAVREALSTTFDRFIKDAEEAKPGTKPTFATQLLELSGTPRGKELLSDLLTVTTRTAVPLIMHRMTNPNRTQLSQVRNLQPDPQPQKIVEPDGALPRESPERKERRSILSFVTRSKPAGWTGNKSSVRNQDEVQSMLSEAPRQSETPLEEQGKEPVAESVASTTNQFLQLTDKSLLRDLVKTVASEAVRSYLTTQADLRSKQRLSVAERSSHSQSNSGTEANETYQTTSGTVVGPTSSRMAAREVIAVFVDSLRLRESDETGWLLF